MVQICCIIILNVLTLKHSREKYLRYLFQVFENHDFLEEDILGESTKITTE